ncbi:MAG TPA: YceI family protein [Thermohalobaculum sp.]|nr:YceI family protein [Thermohalobaculum sp.]
MIRALEIVGRLAPLILAGAAMAAPQDYVVVPELSSVSFHFTEGGVARAGEFERFTGTGTFDAEAPREAALAFEVESGSIELGNAIVEEFARAGEWFDSSNHASITFRLTALEPIAGERYLAEGVLGIKGRERPISAPVRLSFGDGEVEAEGDLRVDREAYRLGTGASQAFVDIGDEVSVRFELVARPVE